MVESIEWFRIFILNHSSLEYLIIFFGAAFGGEFSLFAFGFLLGQEVLSIPTTIMLSFVGAFLPNIFWFFLAKTNVTSKIFLHKYTNNTTLVITEAIEKISHGSHLLALILIKFTVGTPVMLIVYINKTKMSFRNFIYYESAAILLSLLVIMPVGYLSGIGFGYLTSVFNDLYSTIGFILLTVIIIVVTKSFIKKKITQNV